MRWRNQVLILLTFAVTGCGGSGGGSSQGDGVADGVADAGAATPALPQLEIEVSEIEFSKLGSDEPLQPGSESQ